MLKVIITSLIIFYLSLAGVHAQIFEDPDLLWYFPMDMPGGTNVYDMGTGVYNATLTGGDFVPGQKNNGLSFQGAGIISIPEDYLYDISQPQTVSMWIYPESNGVVYSARTQEAALYFRAQGDIIQWGGTTIDVPDQPGGAWYHFAYTWDGTTHRVYANGNEIASSTVPIVSGTPSHATTLARRNVGSTHALTGRLDEAAFWNRTLTPAEIQEVYAHGQASAPPNRPPDDVTPPQAPGSLSVRGTTYSTIEVSWQPAIDPESDIDHYRVYRNGVFLGTADGTSYKDILLNPTTQYTYEVSAVNIFSLESPRSNAINAQTDGLPIIPDLAPGEPVVYFSDMVSAPKNGWSADEPNKGASVTIFGNNWGSTRGSSYVTVNGVSLTDDSDYAVWGEYWPTQFVQRTTFWLNDQMSDGEGEITVTVDGNTSNALPFTIRNGRIFFVNRSNSGGTGSLVNPFSYTSVLGDNADSQGIIGGDILYVRDGLYDARNAHASIMSLGKVTATKSMPFSVIAYPGEKPQIYNDNTGNSKRRSAVRMRGDYYVFAGFDVETTGASAVGAVRDYSRVIGNDLRGMTQQRSQSGSGILGVGAPSGEGSQIVSLGNAVHGGTGNWKQDHAIYLAGCSSDGGQIVGWNHIYDNDFNRGPLISINHMDDTRLNPPHRCKDGPPKQIMDSHFIFNNVIDCGPRRARAIYQFQQSYKPGEVEPEPNYVYNNVIISCGNNDANGGGAPTASFNNGHLVFVNNVLYDSGWVGINFGGGNRLTAIVENNIFHMNPTVSSAPRTGYVRIDGSSDNIIMNNNLFYGMGAWTGCGNCQESGNLVGDPLFVDAPNGDFRLQATSSARGTGKDITFDLPPPDFAAIELDADYLKRNSPFDIGAYRYGAVRIVANQAPRIDAFKPNRLSRHNKSMMRIFNVTASDINGDTITYTWYVNGSHNSSAGEFTLSRDYIRRGVWNITVNVSDGTLETSRSWLFKVRVPKKQDITDDDVVDIRDLRIIAKHVIKKKAFREQYDQNSDGIVNIFDLISVIREFGNY